MPWASATKHTRTWDELPSTSRVRCNCGCQKRATHLGRANGLGMMSGCEFYVRRWVKDPNARPAEE